MCDAITDARVLIADVTAFEVAGITINLLTRFKSKATGYQLCKSVRRLVTGTLKYADLLALIQGEKLADGCTDAIAVTQVEFVELETGTIEVIENNNTILYGQKRTGESICIGSKGFALASDICFNITGTYHLTLTIQ